ncbi:MAG: hypothetical protein NTX40_08120 [Planctomycetota bacterium]|nr:hypothetical protein [Planctomycetota bacterium]
MRARTMLWLFVGCIVLGGIGTRAFAVTDDMEQDLWTLGHVPGYDGTWAAEYSTVDKVSPERSIRLLLSGGGQAGHDGDAVSAVRQFDGNLLGRRLQVKYNIAQQTDVADDWGGMHGSADVIVSVLDATGTPLGSRTYRLACSDLHEKPTWYAHMGGNAGSPCHQTVNITYIGTPDAGGEYEPGPGWQTLDVAPAEDILVDWTSVASVQVKLVVNSCFMHLDTFEVFFDDLNLTPAPATVDIDPNTLDLKSQGKWITAYITLPEGYDVGDIDISTVQLDGIIAAAWGDDCEDDALMVKFDREAVIAHLKGEGLTLPTNVTLKVTGGIGDLLFEGSDTIRVIEPPKPPAGPKGGKVK